MSENPLEEPIDAIPLAVGLENENVEEEKTLQKPKAKKVVTEKQREIGRKNLEKGRAALAKKQEQAREEKKVMVEKKVIEKAEKLIKIKANKEKKIDKILGNNDDVEIEEHVTIKPKKKKIIYREESDSEEEVIVKTKKTEKPEKPEIKAKPSGPTFRINFV